MNIDKEFEDKCLKERTIKIPPTVTIIKQEEEKTSLSNQHKNNSEYFLEGSQNLLKSITPLPLNFLVKKLASKLI